MQNWVDLALPVSWSWSSRQIYLGIFVLNLSSSLAPGHGGQGGGLARAPHCPPSPTMPSGHHLRLRLPLASPPAPTSGLVVMVRLAMPCSHVVVSSAN